MKKEKPLSEKAFGYKSALRGGIPLEVVETKDVKEVFERLKKKRKLIIPSVKGEYVLWKDIKEIFGDFE